METHRSELYERQYTKPVSISETVLPKHDVQTASIEALIQTRERQEQRWLRVAEAVTAQACRIN